MKIDFEYQEIVRSYQSKKMKIVGHIYKCRSGYFYRSKSGTFRSGLFKNANQVKARLKSGEINI
tara:strand:- start:4713 stop:4904 length:192 start_codon:yes stop_codon:yes gene_type:complete